MTGANAHPAYETPRVVTSAASVVLEENPSNMTLEGTNTWILRGPDAPASIVVDPGYLDTAHLERVVAAAGPVELIVLTHHHPDHADGAPWLAERTGAPVRAFDPGLCLEGDPLGDGDVVRAAGLELTVLHTPGHCADSVSLRFDHGGVVHVLTGDTVLGRGTTVVEHIGDYLRSLDRLAELPAGSIGLTGHGPEREDLLATVDQYRRHRQQRLDEIRGALDVLGTDATPRQIVEHVYADVDRGLWPAAEASVTAQLEYLQG
ncbi:glyoxylase-like metal-dependent hydrolase (beta-lactamase superfamily II) [Prauserella sediminis]|uniref:Glyoxylase-like metal-dependent hydrolase (Beta-lactamase superfamily II) n=1 Tax=Prauserella sediminis TaxID=577680 RepID=A0A839XH09_9PSEU|nr:MBL fold metallo-hydrolase [Prauserella sediminis]MBB3663252.1 glyoxylase-like metal-dependent hydrolase (beta-lactamase superfamily II) [Prauserella sediminis]